MANSGAPNVDNRTTIIIIVRRNIQMKKEKNGAKASRRKISQQRFWMKILEFTHCDVNGSGRVFGTADVSCSVGSGAFFRPFGDVVVGLLRAIISSFIFSRDSNDARPSFDCLMALSIAASRSAR
mmetsp:Transcript_2540/g.3961  ORF Transcript_2540/g.3961 Transcript_2540/m.3961 type:complete len:125 (+) Transcript_2540:170-544(+)